MAISYMQNIFLTSMSQHLYHTQYGYCLYRGNGRKGGNGDVMKELGWGEVERGSRRERINKRVDQRTYTLIFYKHMAN